jgi:hypothetical protein
MIQRAFGEALLALPAEEYDWFDIHARTFRSIADGATVASSPSLSHEVNGVVLGAAEPALGEDRQRQFFEFAGPLFSVTVSPASTMVQVSETKELQALPPDRSRRRVDYDLTFQWQIVDGAGALAGMHNQTVTFLAPAEPGLTRVKVMVCQRDVVCTSEGVITVTHELMGQLGTATVSSQGLPGYTFERAPGASWRSRLDAERNVIVVNNGHRDFVYASRSKSLKLRYLVRLYGFAKRRIRRVVNEPRTRAWCEVDARRIDVALQPAQSPRRMGQIVQEGEVLDHACAMPEQCHAIAV